MKKWTSPVMLFVVLMAWNSCLSAQVRDINAGPIWNNDDAKTKCPSVCQKENAEWTGHWKTTEPGKMSVCNCKSVWQFRDIEAGPIWNNDDAKTKCPSVCDSNGASWTGNWVTTVQGQMSVCNCRLARDIEAGPIWNNDDAKVKCPNVCQQHGAQWTGNWVTTVQGQMSVCNCK